MCDCLWELDLVTDKLYFEIPRWFHVTQEWVFWMLIPILFYSSSYTNLKSSPVHCTCCTIFIFKSLAVVCTHPHLLIMPPPPLHTHTHHSNTPWRKSSEIIILYPVICIQSGQQFTCLQSRAFLPCWSFYSKIVLGVAFAKKVYVKWKQN